MVFIKPTIQPNISIFCPPPLPHMPVDTLDRRINLKILLYEGSCIDLSVTILNPDTNNTMPQLIPFYFLNQISYAFLILFVLFNLISRFILPYFSQLQLVRLTVVRP